MRIGGRVQVGHDPSLDGWSAQEPRLGQVRPWAPQGAGVDEQIPARFDELTWTAAPGALSAASFERTEVYRVIEDRGPVFAKGVADELGMERTVV